jgi:hypothetical protein
MNAYIFATENNGIHRKTMLVFSSFDKLVEHAIEVGRNRHTIANDKNLSCWKFVAFKFKMNELKEYEDITEDVLEEIENRGVFDFVRDKKNTPRTWKWLGLCEECEEGWNW